MFDELLKLLDTHSEKLFEEVLHAYRYYNVAMDVGFETHYKNVLY
jgi:hypothetical protein